MFLKWTQRLLLPLALMSIPVLAAEQTVQVPGPLGALSGSLVAVADPQAPVVLIVPGAGPTDRDGNNPLGIRAATYRLLAQGLAGQGISSLRIDKRGLFGSRAAIANPNQVTVQDYASDVRLWMSYLAQRERYRCVWLLGHSEGGLVAMLAAQNNPDLCGVILLAAPGRPMGQVLRSQLARNPVERKQLDAALAVIDSLERGVPVAEVPGVLQPLLRPEVQSFLISGFALDPAQLLSRVNKPVLILQGNSDLQVGINDAEALHAARPGSVLRILAGVNHVFKAVPQGDHEANVAAYGDPDLPLASGVIEPIVQVIHGAAH
ncbi:alpha/beta fold hydrolase [Pseudomonas sp. LJDD11]|uniref:alpha/beta hydrolase n=1 Tax=unclassified Pseudomonas TaxID=196821 RepID=UPI0004F90124|nr:MULTISPECIES: alpha/beta fold hydrolase [unclassified Pseudomonas]MCO8162219.1 alpha/beta fold hydrolase [Pseudomonas sp. 21LCFQ010]MCQ9422507.1 alpha/beta fold hydrolase [Pseudomonas sp. LJDD11]BAP43689.1 putative hydrolase [Pseudomonas sp. StFLB209]